MTHHFDSSRVTISVRPCDVETLLDWHFGTYNAADYSVVADIALAYADHSRVCALLARGWNVMLSAWLPVFAQVTDIAPDDAWWDDSNAVKELERRFNQSVIAIEHCQW